ncbi:hypothetical protein CISIN_1g037929mg, partial [Citrus sinensis]
TLISFFAKVNGRQSSNEASSPCNIDASSSPMSQRVEFEKVDIPSTIDTPYLEHDTGLRISIKAYPIDKREDVRIAYINMRSFQPELQKYLSTKHGMQNRRFQFSWFSKFRWFEYSVSKDKTFCFSCFLFHDASTKYDAFIADGSHGSFHNAAMVKWSNLNDPSRHIDKRMNAQSSKQVLENRLRLKTLIIATKWLTKQACAFGGHNELVNSLNHEKFIKLIKLLATMNKEINKIVLENALKNAQYIALKIQKELLNILANKVQHKIHEEIRDAKFCILVDEALDESHKEQMAIILRYIDCDGFIRECFFEVVNVDNIKASLLKNEICNFINTSFKRYVELKAVKEKEIVESIVSEELETRIYTRWSSHFTSVSRFIEMFGATLEVLRKMINDGPTQDMCGEAKCAYREMTSFEFVFILLLLDKVLRISNILCRALQTKSLDILNALNYVTITSLYELCRRLIEIKKSQHYFLIDRLIHLMLTIPVSTTTTESVFSAMSLIKISLRSKMKNKFLSDYMVVYTEKEITNTIDLDCIID